MPVPSLYLEGRTQRALRGPEHLAAYKLGLIEAILKEVLRAEEGQDVEEIRSKVRTALAVAVWEMRS